MVLSASASQPKHPRHVYLLKHVLIGLFILEIVYFSSTAHQVYNVVQDNRFVRYLVIGELIVIFIGLFGVFTENFCLTQTLGLLHVLKVGAWLYVILYIEQRAIVNTGYLILNIILVVLMFWYGHEIKHEGSCGSRYC